MQHGATHCTSTRHVRTSSYADIRSFNHVNPSTICESKTESTRHGATPPNMQINILCRCLARCRARRRCRWGCERERRLDVKAQQVSTSSRQLLGRTFGIPFYIAVTEHASCITPDLPALDQHCRLQCLFLSYVDRYQVFTSELFHVCTMPSRCRARWQV
jgi:hypothetical protein